MMESFRGGDMVSIAVVGAGAWGKNHIRVFSEFPNVRLKYIFDLDSSKLSSLQNSYPQSTMVHELSPILQDPEIKGVVISSSPVLHFALAIGVLARPRSRLSQCAAARAVGDAEE